MAQNAARRVHRAQEGVYTTQRRAPRLFRRLLRKVVKKLEPACCACACACTPLSGEILIEVQTARRGLARFHPLTRSLG
jgi:hypothetical protein